MSVQTIKPQQALELLEQGAVLIDVRDADEHARERIPQARLVPLKQLQAGGAPAPGARAIVFHCRSGNRTRMHAEQLAACAGCDTYLLEGGLDAWKRAGLPVLQDRKQPIELSRQVQITAGLLTLTGVVLGATVSPAFYALSGFVGAGLTFSGLTGTCAMARLLQLAPWNRKAA